MRDFQYKHIQSRMLLSDQLDNVYYRSKYEDVSISIRFLSSMFQGLCGSPGR